MILTATATTIGAMNNFFTLFVLPMFWVSGIFFPLDRLPEWLQQLAWALPLTSATALIRGLFTGQITWLMFLWAGQLFIYGLIALVVASKLMRRRLIK
jgi:lipooligosaccharide transport system permease protein